MIPRFPVAASWAALAIWFGLASPVAAADCQSWQLPAAFNAVEDDGFFVVFELTKTGEGQYSGPAHFHTGSDFHEVKGQASARLDGPRLDITLRWGDTAAYYNASIDSAGFIGGLKTNPLLPEGAKGREVFWKSKQKAACALSEAPQTASRSLLDEFSKKATEQKPVKKLGKAKTATAEKLIKKLGEAKTATAKNDIDVYDNPVQPRRVIGLMRADATATILDRHPDGWCKLKGVAAGADGWVAYDHITNCPEPK